jgi:hypothetical protein
MYVFSNKTPRQQLADIQLHATHTVHSNAAEPDQEKTEMQMPHYQR